MRVISFNANGIRSAESKGFHRWMRRQDPDVVCIQETKAQIPDLKRAILKPRGFHAHFHDAEKRGYSGVAIYSRREPDAVRHGTGWKDIDREGRLIQADFGRLTVMSLYVPSGSSSEERQAFKMRFLERLEKRLSQLIDDDREYIICGDWNLAHTKNDLRNWRSNQKNSGFLPEERAWLDKLYGKVGWVDAHRVVSDSPDEYTWWSNRGQAWAKNVGWRIDLHVVTPGLAPHVRDVSVYKRRRFSDHSPLTIDYDWEP